MKEKIKSAFTLGKDLWDPSQRFETSWFLPPWALFAFRALFCVYVFTTRFYTIGWYCTHDQCSKAKDEFYFFTVLTYWAMGFYFLVSSIHTATYAATGRPLLDKFPRALQALHSFFYTTVVSFPFLVTIVYWAILYDGPWFPVSFDAWRNVSQHLLNAFFALFEIVVPRTSPPPWIHALYTVVVLALYLGLAYLREHIVGKPPYDFLDRGEDGPGGPGMVAAYCVGVLIASIVMFCIAKALVFFRVWVTERKLHLHGKFAKMPSSRTRDVEMESTVKDGP